MTGSLDISKLLSKPHFKRLQSIGLIDNVALRNFRIKSDYEQLRKEFPRTEAIFLLTDKYCLS